MNSIEQMEAMCRQQQAQWESREAPYHVVLMGTIGEDRHTSRYATDPEADETAQREFEKLKDQGATTDDYECVEVREVQYGETARVLRRYEF